MSIENENATKISPENYWVYECRVIDEVVCDSHNQKEMLCARSMIGLIMPSIFSVSRKFADRYPGYRTTDMMMVYGAIIDLDCKQTFETKQETLQHIENAIHGKVKLQKLCTDCLDLGELTEAVEVLRKRVREKGFSVRCWLMGNRGYRVMWVDPKCCIQYISGVDVNLEMAAYMQKYLGAACCSEISELCNLKCVVSNVANMGPYFPIIPLDEVLGNTRLHQTDDDDIIDEVRSFWEELKDNMPCWEDCTQFHTKCGECNESCVVSQLPVRPHSMQQKYARIRSFVSSGLKDVHPHEVVIMWFAWGFTILLFA